jgi:ABC-type glutathione transport system ATPase component
MEVQTNTAIFLPESLLKKLSCNQRLIIEALASKPEGILSKELTHETGVSNKSDIIKKIRDKLSKYGIKLIIHRHAVHHQALWKLCV